MREDITKVFDKMLRRTNKILLKNYDWEFILSEKYNNDGDIEQYYKDIKLTFVPEWYANGHIVLRMIKESKSN